MMGAETTLMMSILSGTLEIYLRLEATVFSDDLLLANSTIDLHSGTNATANLVNEECLHTKK